MSVTVITKDPCQPCKATKRKLSALGVEYVERPLGDDPGAYDLAVALGHQGAPVVVVEREGQPVEHWSGYRPERLEALAS